MQIVDDQASILIVDGEPRWEFRYLETALHRDERVKVDVVVFRQPFMGLLPDAFFPRSLTCRTTSGNLEESPFSKYDLVIVGDVSPQQLTEDGWRWLDRYVRDEGGTLVLAAGKRSFPFSTGRRSCSRCCRSWIWTSRRSIPPPTSPPRATAGSAGR